MTSMKQCSLCLVALALLAGCKTVGPDYTEPLLPEADYTDVLSSASATDEAHGPVTAENLAAWWDTLNDPLLTELVERALAGNLDIQQARSRVRMARLQLGIVRSGLYPQADAGLTYTRRRDSEHTDFSQERSGVQEAAGTLSTGIGVVQTASMLGNDPVSALLRVPGQVAGWPTDQSQDLESDFYRAGFDAAWEMDIFGGTRRAVEASAADLDAVQESLRSTWVSLAGAVAQSYIDLRTYQARLHVAESNLDTQKETLAVFESLHDAGLSSELVVQQVSYVVESTRAMIPSLRSGIEATMNTLAVLTGEMPGSLHDKLREAQPVPVAALTTVTGIPANALRQRPDVRMAERQLAAQTARIGEATAELYPKFVLSGSIGLESLESSTLFDSGSDAWSIGPSVSWPIFHAGAIRKNIQVQTELQGQYLAAYESAVLAAAKEVRDALVDFAKEQERYAFLEKADEAARNALHIANDKYRNGLTDFSNVLDAQKSVLSFQGQLAVSKGLISINLVRIYKALGGGWEGMEMP